MKVKDLVHFIKNSTMEEIEKEFNKYKVSFDDEVKEINELYVTTGNGVYLDSDSFYIYEAFDKEEDVVNIIKGKNPYSCSNLDYEIADCDFLIIQRNNK